MLGGSSRGTVCTRLPNQVRVSLPRTARMSPGFSPPLLLGAKRNSSLSVVAGESREESILCILLSLDTTPQCVGGMERRAASREGRICGLKTPQAGLSRKKRELGPQLIQLNRTRARYVQKCEKEKERGTSRCSKDKSSGTEQNEEKQRLTDLVSLGQGSLKKGDGDRETD